MFEHRKFGWWSLYAPLEDLSALMPSDKQVVLDTRRVQFADSSGLGLIRSLERTFQEEIGTPRL